MQECGKTCQLEHAGNAARKILTWPASAARGYADAASATMQVLSLETHKALAKPGEVEHLKNLLINQGFQWSTSGEYDVWATAELQKRIVPA